MYITAFVNRDELFDLATRWLAGDLQAGDGRFATEAFTFESLISAPTALMLAHKIGQVVAQGPIRTERVRNKDTVRRRLVETIAESTPRIRELYQCYQNNPRDYFPQTPADITLAYSADGRLVGMTRIKRTQRIAEKVSRRISDRLAGHINQTAIEIARQRAEKAHLPLEALISSIDEMSSDFEEAERRVARAFSEGLTFSPEELRIDDIVGFKFVGSDRQLELIERVLLNTPNVSLVERELHRGQYNDTNILVDINLPSKEEILQRAKELDPRQVARRGLEPKHFQRDLAAYLERGRDTFRAEFILTSCEELVESEFGRSIHEERILEQRRKLAYRGRIAHNARYIIEYLLHFAVSPEIAINQIPFAMDGRYLPDTFNQQINRLFGIDADSPLFDDYLMQVASKA